MMKTAPEVDAQAVLQRPLGGQDRSTGVQHESVYHLRGVGNFHLQLFAYGQAALHQFVHVVRRMHQQDIGLAGWSGSNEIAFLSRVLLQQALAN